MQNGGMKMKQAIIVRKDLKMSCGKIAGQVAHASLDAYLCANRTLSDHQGVMWIEQGKPKIVLKVHSEEGLWAIIDKCFEKKLAYSSIRDLGKTQLEPYTLTAVGIGPYEDKIIDQIVGDLKLL